MSETTERTISKYALKVDSAEHQRLDSQFKCYQQGIFSTLNTIQLKPGMCVVDMGCGSGIMTAHLAHAVGPTGHVYALDGNDAQLKRTSDRLSALDLNNVTYIHADFEQSLTHDLNADFSYCSLVLEHLENKQQALANLAKMTKPNGDIVLVNSTNFGAWITPSDKRFDQFFNYFLQYSQLKQFDCCYGKRVYQDCTQSPYLKDIHVHGFQPITNQKLEKCFLKESWNTIKEDLIASGLSTTKITQEITDFLNDIIDDDNYMIGMPPSVIISCKRV